VKLTVDGKSYTQPLVVKMDPRINTSLADLGKQFEIEAGSVEGMNQSYEALAQVRSVRGQLKERAAKAGKGGLAEAIAALDKKAAQLEGATQGSFYGLPPSGKPAENLSTLNQHFSGLLGVTDSADSAPTTQAEALYKELQESQGAFLSQWKKIKEQDIPALNAGLKKAGLASVDPSKEPLAAPSADVDGDDEP